MSDALSRLRNMWPDPITREERLAFADELEASRREVAALREALRKHCIKHAQCAECGKSWMFPFGEDYPEEHEPRCLAALSEGTTAAPGGEQ